MKSLSPLIKGSIVALFCSIFPCAFATTEVAGVTLESPIKILHEKTTLELKLNGAGVRSKFFIDLYVGSLYVTHISADTADILTQDNVAIRLNITSEMITSEKMRDAINEGFDNATAGESSAIRPQIDSFMALFSDEIKKGDQFTFVANKATGITAYKNGVAQATIEGEVFRQALLNIWLGNKPVQKSLKQAMLGK